MPNVFPRRGKNVIFWRTDVMFEGLEVVMATHGTFLKEGTLGS
jgi:hypothetical protein